MVLPDDSTQKLKAIDRIRDAHRMVIIIINGLVVLASLYHYMTTVVTHQF